MDLNIIALFIINLPVTLIFIYLKEFYSPLDIQTQKVALGLATFSGFLFTLLFGFTFSGLNERYRELNDYINEQATTLDQIYRLSNRLPLKQRNNIRSTLKAYLNSLIEEEWPARKNGTFSLHTKQLEEQLHNEISEANNEALDNLTFSLDKIRTLSSTPVDDFLFVLVIIAGIITLISFWFVNLSRFSSQFVIDYGVISLVLLGIYFLYLMLHPYNSHILQLKPQAYIELRNKIGFI